MFRVMFPEGGLSALPALASPEALLPLHSPLFYFSSRLFELLALLKPQAA